ncbi:MAG: phosphoribosylanthranilate isomerase [Candidatus Susulua stagnicola]|nr:phosphoribosylanthranilate isomerase [Candidatus Susulua stagnicola]
MKVKICGITNSKDAALVSSVGADAIGFIFSKKSPRCISTRKAEGIIKSLDPFIVKVGVFLNQDKQEVSDIASSLNLDVLQFHGKETPAYCHSFKPRFKVIKVFFPEDSPYERKISGYKVDAFMFDVKYEKKLNGEKTLSTKDLKELSNLIKKGKRIIISGGLNINNISKIKRIKPYALDVASGVESMVGEKDSQLVSAFVNKVKYEVA